MPKTELNLKYVLTTGQSFRWYYTNDNVYTGVINNKAIQIKQNNHELFYRCIGGIYLKNKITRNEIIDYFNLNVSLNELNEKWKLLDDRYLKISDYIKGARVLRQDPFECLFQFICSSNNNINRIQNMVQCLCEDYGSPLVTENQDNIKIPILNKKRKFEDVFDNYINLYSFPTLAQLNKASEENLRNRNFGYRSKYIIETIEKLNKKDKNWLLSLRHKSYDEASNSLCELSGIGPKVAACICLFSLDKHQAIPVDTHVWKIAMNYYNPELKGKTLTNAKMKLVEKTFINIFGNYAGWAHNALFIAELNNGMYVPEIYRTQK